MSNKKLIVVHFEIEYIPRMLDYFNSLKLIFDIEDLCLWDNEFLGKISDSFVNYYLTIKQLKNKTKNMNINENNLRKYRNHLNNNINKNKIKNIIFNIIKSKYNILFYCRIPDYILEIINKDVENNNIYFLNTEQLTAQHHIDWITNNINKKFKIIDYSYENIKILKDNYLDSVLIPYQVNLNEIINVRQSVKPSVCVLWQTGNKRRDLFFNKLKNFCFIKNIKLTLIDSFYKKRDNILFKHDILINIHTSNTYNIFEELRCNRCIFNKMIVLTEESRNIENHLLNEYLIYVSKQNTNSLENYFDKILNKLEDIINNYNHYYSKLFNNFNIFKIQDDLCKVAINNLIKINCFNEGIYKEINTKIHQVRSGAMIKYSKELFYKKSNINIPLDSNKNIYNYKDYHKGEHCLIICAGAAMDFVSPDIVDKYDKVLGINNVYKKYKCNYIITKEGNSCLFEKIKDKNSEINFCVRSNAAKQYYENINFIFKTYPKIYDSLDFNIKEDYIDKNFVFQSRTTFTTAIHIAAILGFKYCDIMGYSTNITINNKYYFKGYNELSDKLKYLTASCLHKSTCPNLEKQTEKLITQIEKIYDIKYNIINPNINETLINNVIGLKEINYYLHINYNKYKDNYNIKKLEHWDDWAINYYCDYDLLKIDTEIGEDIQKFYKENNIFYNSKI